MLRACIRSVLLTSLVTGFLFESWLWGRLLKRYPTGRKMLRAELLSEYSKRALRILDIQVELTGTRPDPMTPYLIVANHLSYVDAWIIASVKPTAFVTSQEVAQSLEGKLARAAGCLFMERRSKSRLREELCEQALHLKEGLSLAVFPEATSSDGKEILPFKAAAFESAIQSRVACLPIYLRYFGSSNVAYYGDHRLGPHLWSLLKSRGTRAKVQVLESLTVGGECRKAFRDRVYAQLASAHAQSAKVPVY